MCMCTYMYMCMSTHVVMCVCVSALYVYVCTVHVYVCEYFMYVYTCLDTCVIHAYNIHMYKHVCRYAQPDIRIFIMTACRTLRLYRHMLKSLTCTCICVYHRPQLLLSNILPPDDQTTDQISLIM